MTALETLSIKYLFEHAPETLVFFVALFTVFLYVAIRVNGLISKANADREQYAARVAVLEKQQHKCEQLFEACPCITKCNATWLQDKGRNGGQPPERVACQYLAAKERGEK